MNHKIFREYDIRGVADRDLDDNTVRALGLAIGEHVLVRGRRVAVGRDCRLSSDRLFRALVDGILMYADVIDLGIVPTPMVYFAQSQLLHQPAASIMITGSHNPGEDNGFKMMIGDKTLYGDAIADLRRDVLAILPNVIRADDDPMKIPTPRPAISTSVLATDLTERYLHVAETHLRMGKRRFTVVVDAGNGVGGQLAVALYRRLGFEVIPLFCEFDGRFPNHHPDPTQPENLVELKDAVRASGAEIGIALDGDGDRLGVVDSNGRVLWGDHLMILLGKAVLAEVPNATFVGEVKCSQTMYDELAKAGGRPHMYKVGHSLIKARMRELGASLAGEMSGHLFFAHRWLGFDDGIYAGARMLELLSRGDTTLAELADGLPVAINTPEIRVDCPDDRKFEIVETVRERLSHDPAVRDLCVIDGVRAKFDDGWGLVRASNTQAALVMRCEASSDARIVEIAALMGAHIKEARDYLGV